MSKYPKSVKKTQTFLPTSGETWLFSSLALGVVSWPLRKRMIGLSVHLYMCAHASVNPVQLEIINR